jgi:hypothetical protein
MTSRIRCPHTPYIHAVTDALRAAGRAPADWFVDDSETGDDGETMTLTAVLTWDGGIDGFPDGLLLRWDLEQGWQWAEMLCDGSNRVPEDLPVPLWAAPSAVVGCVVALLDGGDLPASDGVWHDDAVAAAVAAWEAL